MEISCDRAVPKEENNETIVSVFKYLFIFSEISTWIIVYVIKWAWKGPHKN